MKRPPPSIRPVAPDPSPVVTAVEISDPTAVGQGIEVIKQDAVHLGGKPLRVRRVTVRLGSSMVVFYSTNSPIRTRSVLQAGLMGFVAFGPKAVGTANGLPVGPGRILTCALEVTVEMVVSAGYESMAFFLPLNDIRAHLRGRHREGQFRVPTGLELLQTSVAAASELYDWGRRLADTAARKPEVFDSPQIRCVAQIELVEALLATLDSAVDARLAPRDLTSQAHSRLVRIAEDYALAHAAEHLYVTDLCRAAKVSERTLQYAFKEIMGMTPVAYLTRLRLHQLRQALRAADARSTTVTAEALKWGFWHFGDFSRAYRDCFGELPSDTLRHGRRT